MNKKKLKDLNLMDDFLFQAIMTYPDIGELFAQRILELIFHRQFQNLTIVAQKVYGGMDTDLRGARLDLYVEENDRVKMDATYDDSIYDLEPDRNNKVPMVKAFPKRARFYHATIDRHILKSGEEFGNLKNVYVIFLCNYDPFGYDRMQYTIKNMCVEDTDHVHAVSDTLRELQEMVDIVKHDGEVSLAYMKWFEHDRMMMEEGREEERKNIERERLRAENAEARAYSAETRASSAETELAKYRLLYGKLPS